MNFIPAFGFETKHHHADGCRIIDSVAQEKVVQGGRFSTNVLKILGYIPLVGMFIGIHRIHTASKWQGGIQEVLAPGKKWNHIARGTIEALNLGILLLIPDIILTIHRERQPQRHMPEF